jgi:DNA-binding beta-propeller fold protein YncE
MRFVLVLAMLGSLASAQSTISGVMGPIQSPRLAGQDRELVAAELVQSIPNTSQHITPLAPRSSRFQYLNPGLTDAPDWLAGQAVTAVTSPDGQTLLVLTSGYNRISYKDGPKAGSTNPTASTEHIFVYEISRNTPLKKQVIHVSNTYQGIVFDPGGKSFYVPGGVDDNLHTYSLQANGIWAEDLSSPIKLNHSSGVGMSVSPEAAGIDMTRDGSTIVVTNYYNDSVSVLSKSGGGTWTVSAEVDLRPGKADPSKAGVPGGEYPLWVSIKGNDTAYVSSIRDREIVIVSLTGKPAVTGRIKLTGQPLKMALDAAQTTLYVAEDQIDSVAVIDTVANKLVKEVAVGAPAGLLADPVPSSRATARTMSRSARTGARCML